MNWQHSVPTAPDTDPGAEQGAHSMLSDFGFATRSCETPFLLSQQNRFARLEEGFERNWMPHSFFHQPGEQLLHALDEKLPPLIVERHDDQLVVIIRRGRHRDRTSLAAHVV